MNDMYNKEEKKEIKVERAKGEPTFAFVAASWSALLVGVLGYLVGLYNATMELNEKGYYFTILLFGLYSAVSLQKAVRDREEDIPVTGVYFGISWFAVLSAISLMVVGLWNAGSIIRSEKGFYAIAFVLSMFAGITVQKNIRDTAKARESEDK